MKGRGIEVLMVTSDTSGHADLVAGELGIRVLKGVSPEEKADLVRELKPWGKQ
ncbi:MAG: hypothetical protein ACP5HQ_00290 [Thermoprotei archaeon]